MLKLKRKKQARKNSGKNYDLGKIVFSKKGIIFFTLLGISAGLIIFTYGYLSKSAYFNIESVEVRGTNLTPQLLNKKIFNTAIGENIFTLGLTSVHNRLIEEYPEIQDLKVIKQFPNKLVLRIKARKPIAQVLYYNKLYPVDAESVIIPNISDIAQKNLPVIGGINFRFDQNIGKKCNSKQLEKTFLLIDAMRNSGFLSEHDLGVIDASDYKNLSFFIEDGIEIKIGDRDFPERLGRLKKTFLDPKINKSEIKYLDLRFEDVTIGPKAIK